MNRRRPSLRRALTLTFVGVGLATLVATAGVAAIETVRASDRADAVSSQRLASGTALELSHAFDEWSNELLVASQNDALKAWYRAPSGHGLLRESIDASLVGLYDLYPDLIHEACFIDARGPEVARQVSGTAAKQADLSPDESANPFFAATLALKPGQVHQHTPYVSPDTHVWVVSNSTPIAIGGHNVALLHFETNLDPLRLRIARTLPLRTFVRVVDTRSERVVFRTDQSVPDVDINAPLANQPLPPAKALTVPSGFRTASALVPFGPTNSNHWRVEVVTPAAPAVSSATLTWLGILGIVVTFGLVVVGWLVARRIVRPIIAVTAHAERMAAGDLTGRLRLRRRDELGRLACAVDTASDAVTDVIRSLTESSTALGTAAADLGATSDRLAAAADEASRRAAAAQEASSAVDAGIQTLSAGTAQVASSIAQIAAGAAEAAEVARGSVAAVDHAGTEIIALASASDEIDGVVALIATIAGQTNLLALNATIEAARAGEAGKGFAVVADEVKQLAQQTARATGDISTRIAAIQTRSAAANESVDALGSVITKINELNSIVAQTVEEHARTATEMSTAARGAAIGSNENTKQVVAVARVTTATADGAQASRHAADSVTQVAQRIAEIAATFKTG